MAKTRNSWKKYANYVSKKPPKVAACLIDTKKGTMMLLSIDYMKRFIYQILKGLEDYQAIFTIFTICLKSTGSTYQKFRAKAIKNKLQQMTIKF